MLELVKAGGWPMIPLLALTVLALAIILERAWTLRRIAVAPPNLGQEVRTWAAGGTLDPAHIDSLRATSPLGALLAAALGTIAAAGPLLGLFGTVVGMIQMFLVIGESGMGDVNELAGGIGKALVCTATGMIVAIPALMAHRWFRGRIAEYIVDMEHEAIRLLDTLQPAAASAEVAAGGHGINPPVSAS